MSPVTHLLTGWVFANCARLERKDRALVTLASVAPDLDGLGIIPELLTRSSAHPLQWFSLYHHVLHSLPFALVVALVAAILAARNSIAFWLALVSFHLHLLEDLLGSRGPDGYQWPIPYLAPFSARFQLAWSGQWQLNAWPNFLITLSLLATTLYLSWRKGFSPVEMISPGADLAFIHTIRSRFPRATN
jgi:inner membrane protein